MVADSFMTLVFLLIFSIDKEASYPTMSIPGPTRYGKNFFVCICPSEQVNPRGVMILLPIRVASIQANTCVAW